MWWCLDSVYRLRARGYDLAICTACRDVRVHEVSEVRHYPRWLGIHLSDGKCVGGCLECAECGSRVWRNRDEPLRFHHSSNPATLVECLRPVEQRRLLSELQNRSRPMLGRSSSSIDHLRAFLLRAEDARGQSLALAGPRRIEQVFSIMRILGSLIGLSAWWLGYPAAAVALALVVISLLIVESWCRSWLMDFFVHRAVERQLRSRPCLIEDLCRSWRDVADVLPPASRAFWQTRLGL